MLCLSMVFVQHKSRFVLSAVLGVAASVVGMPFGTISAQQDQTIEWRTSRGCPTVQRFRELAEATLGSPLPRDVRIRVTIRRASGGFVMDFTLQQPGVFSSERQGIRDSDCSKVVESGAIALAVALDWERQRTQDRPPLQVPEAYDAEIPRLSAGSTRRQSPAVSVRPSAAIHLAADAGALPNPAAGFGLGLAAQLHQWELRLSGTYYPGHRVRVEAPAAADIWFVTTNGRVCYWLGQLAGCLGGQLGRMKGKGFEVFGSVTEGTASYVGLTSAVVLSLPVRKFLQFQMLGSLDAALVRPVFTMKGLELQEIVVHRARRLSTHFHMAVRFGFR